MGVFSRLFGGLSKSNRSYVRKWVKEHHRKGRYSSDHLTEIFFASIMYCLCAFCNKDMRGYSPEFKRLGLYVNKHYSGDAALFELGCYMYSRIDLWLHKHKPRRRKSISTTVADKFIELFTQAIKSKDIPALFDQRISQYAKLARTGADAEKYHFHLEQLILRAIDNQPPQSYDFGNEPVVIVDIAVRTCLKIELSGWETGMIPALFKNIEHYCDLIETNRSEYNRMRQELLMHIIHSR